ncbi:hypothetical protein AB0K18_30645 [Nonomuraea sp. NPDC049421]|uniref:hypothetical protein n=1 Tax=Nonomuraea sp. NPDC049421 TaxID=3155275 RepID=UPI00341AC369
MLGAAAALLTGGSAGTSTSTSAAITGNWRACCKRRYNPAGTLTRVDLHRYCLACRSPETPAAGRP